MRTGWVLCLVSASLSVAVLAACAEPAPPVQPAPSAHIEYAPGREICRLANKIIKESSGIAASRVHEGVFWTHNDSGGRSELYAFNAKGEDLGAYKVPGANVDWEDICAFKAGGKGHLVIADTGDNLHVRKSYALYICEEPERRPEVGRKPEADLKLVRKIEFTYPDGVSRDCEAVAAEPDGSVIYLVSKIRSGTDGRIFALDLKAAKDAKDGKDAEPVKPRAIAGHQWLNVTGMDISPDGRRAVLQTYILAYQFVRAADQTWEQAFKVQPETVALPVRPQGEGVTYGPDGRTLYLTSESGQGCPLYVMEPKATPEAKPEPK